MADKNYKMKFAMSDGTTQEVQFSVPEGKTAYQYAQDGGYTGSEEEFAKKLAAEWQGKLTGSEGQVVGFDAEGNAVAQEAPEGGGSIPTVVEGTPDTLTWDGNTDGLVMADGNFFDMSIYKISDVIPDADSLAGGAMASVSGGDALSLTFDTLEENIYALINDGGIPLVFVILAENVVYEEITFPEKGIYMLDLGAGAVTLTIPGYTGFAQKKIDPAYLYQPDFAQTDESQPDAIKNLPFGDFPTGGDTLEWDGNTEGKTSVAGVFYKVSDVIPTLDELANATFVASDGFQLTNDGTMADNYDGIIIFSEAVWIATADGVQIDGKVFPSAGTYFIYEPDVFTASLTIPGYTGFPSVKKLDEKYLPDSVKAQPDWNQNDETAADYVKNRTHYSEYGEVFLLHETEVMGTAEDVGYAHYFSVSLFSGEESLSITFDGVPYKCNLQNVNDLWIYGNAALLGGIESEEPFALAVMPTQIAAIFMQDAETHTVAISAWKNVYHKLPAAYVDTRKIFYILDDIYIYTDNACSIKATKDEVAAAILENNIVFKYANANMVCVPIMVDTASKDYAIARVTMNYGTEPSWILLYTAEYTPTT